MAELIRKRNSLILFIYFSLGAFALISQTIILREFFVVVYGNEFIFGVLLANWLTGIFFGAISGGYLAEKSTKCHTLFTASITVMCILLPVSITFTRLLYKISNTPPGEYIGFFKVFVFSAILIIPISFFIGFIFPVAAKVQTHSNKNQPRDSHQDIASTGDEKGIANIYIFESIGSLISGIIYTFVLVGHCNPYLIISLISIPLLTGTGIFSLKIHHVKTAVLIGFILGVNIYFLLPAVNETVNRKSSLKRWESISTLPLEDTVDSKYQNIAVAKLFDQTNLYLNTMLATVFPNTDDNMLLGVQLVCQHPDPKRVLIVGDAVSGLAKALFKLGIKEIVSVEIDPKVVETTLKFLSPEDKSIVNYPGFKIIIRDGRNYVKNLIRSGNQNTTSYDLVYLNIPEPSTLLLNRFYTRNFFSDIQKILTPGGVLALRVTSSENYESGIVTDYTASIFHTLKSIFPEIAVTPGTQNIFFASLNKESVSDNPEILSHRFTSRGLQPQKMGMIFYSLFPKEKTLFTKEALLLNKKSNLNTDDKPIASLYFNKVIGWYGKSNLTGFLGFIEHIKLWHVSVILITLFVLRMLYMWICGKKVKSKTDEFLRFHTLLAVFSTGLVGLSLEMVILYTFQNYFGDIYYLIGFIIAIFMFGLPVGALISKSWLTKRSGKSRNSVITFIILTQIVLALIAFLLPYITRSFANNITLHQFIIFFETILIGIAVGIIFPLAISLYLGNQKQIGKTAGIIDAFDHIGAAAGAFLVGTLFIPVMGVTKVCTLVTLLPILTSILFLAGKSHSRRSDNTGQ